MLAQRSPERFVVIDADGDVEAVAARVWQAVSDRLQLDVTSSPETHAEPSATEPPS
jgi:hypothetical protein